MIRETPANLLVKRQKLVREVTAGRASASSSSLSRSYGLPVEDVRRILRSNGVQDDG
jgi:hypothetical protein